MSRSTYASRRTIAASLLSLAVAGCKPTAKDQPPDDSSVQVDPGKQDEINRSLAVSVLIDCSGTWLNSAERARNARLLKDVSAGIVGASDIFDHSVLIRWHIIGDKTLGRAPACFARYQRAILKQGDGEIIRQKPQLDDYLAFCSETVLNGKAEARTEIDYGIQTAIEALARFPKGAARRFVIMSDFKQEPAREIELPKGSMTDIDSLLLFRTLPEDQENPSGRDARIAQFERGLTAAGASRVSKASDNAVGGEEIRAFLEAGI